MPVATIYANLGGYVVCTDADLNNVRNGTGSFGINDLGSSAFCGVGSGFSAYQTFLRFPTSSLPAGSTINAATLAVYASSKTGAFVSQVRTYNFGSFSESDFRTAAQFGALPLVTSITDAAISTGSYNDFPDDISSVITAAADTYFVLCTALFISGTFSGSSFLNIDSDNGTNKPRLTIDYTPPSYVASRNRPVWYTYIRR